MKKKLAAVTMAKNEFFHLPYWVKYYSRFIPLEDLWVLDHESDDGSTQGLGCNIVTVRNPLFRDKPWVNKLVRGFHKQLCEKYEIAIYTDVDEIIAPDPRKYKDLGDCIEKFRVSDEEVVSCYGWGILHDPREELAIDMSKPLLKQRKYWHRAPTFDKPLITKVPLNWVPGYHKCHDRKPRRDNDLYLFHTCRLDYEMIKKKLHWELEQKMWHPRYKDKADIERWYFSHFEVGRKELIPEWIKTAF